MSVVVLVIAAAHAIPPVVGAVLGKSNTGVVVGAVVGGVIAIASGSPAFIAADLAGVALGVWLGLSMLNEGSKVVKETSQHRG